MKKKILILVGVSMILVSCSKDYAKDVDNTSYKGELVKNAGYSSDTISDEVVKVVRVSRNTIKVSSVDGDFSAFECEIDENYSSATTTDDEQLALKFDDAKLTFSLNSEEQLVFEGERQ